MKNTNIHCFPFFYLSRRLRIISLTVVLLLRLSFRRDIMRGEIYEWVESIRVKSGNAWQSRERTAINASRYIRFDISAHDFQFRNRESRRARHTDGAKRRMACARHDDYTPNLYEIWRGRRDLERDSRSLSGKDVGWLFVGRNALTYRRLPSPVFDPLPRELFGRF